MKFKTIAAIALLVVLTACSGKTMEGKYVGAAGISLEFKPNGKVVYMGVAEYPYEVDDKEIKLLTPDKGALIVNVVDEQTISMPLVGKLKRVSQSK